MPFSVAPNYRTRPADIISQIVQMDKPLIVRAFLIYADAGKPFLQGNRNQNICLRAANCDVKRALSVWAVRTRATHCLVVRRTAIPAGYRHWPPKLVPHPLQTF